jgi:hypothetical protein
VFGQSKATYAEIQLFFAGINEMVTFPGLSVSVSDRGGLGLKMYEKRRLGCVFCHNRMVPTVSVCSMSRKCRTIPFSGRFLESCYIAHPRSRAKVSGKPVRGYEIGGKTAFRQEKCCTIRNLPRKSESCDKIRRFLPWSRCSQLPELIGRFVPATFAVKRSGESIDSGYSCESELVLHCFAERSQIQIRVFICQVSENPM